MVSGLAQTVAAGHRARGCYSANRDDRRDGGKQGTFSHLVLLEESTGNIFGSINRSCALS